jgi:hypothetical protein
VSHTDGVSVSRYVDSRGFLNVIVSLSCCVALGGVQQVFERPARESRSLIRVEDVRLRAAQRLFDRLHTELRVQSVRCPPTQPTQG